MEITRRALLALAAAAPAAFAETLPRPSPDYQIPLIDGRILKVSDFRGKVLVIEFLLTTCPGCQRAAEALNRVLQQYKGKPVHVVGVAINEGADRLVPQFIQGHNLTFPVGVRDLDSCREYLQIPVVNRMLMPQIAFIDKKGVIRHHFGAGADEAFFADEEGKAKATIDKLLAEGAPAARPRPLAKKK